MSSTLLDRPLRLLVIDDDVAIQRLLGVVFRRHSFVVEHAFDGQAGLRELRTSVPDAVLLDLMMPGLNGFEVVRELKRIAPELLARTIVLTAASESTLRNFDDANAIRRLIRKPFDLSELVREVLSCSLLETPTGVANAVNSVR
jgi:DNA-binding response OmpR family regulator